MEDLKKYIENLRSEYSGEVLDEKTVQREPHKQFEIWMLEAVNANVEVPNAMILATADKTGKPSVRTVLLRDFSDKGFTFFTNYNSRKGKEIDENPFGSLLFYWPELHRQVRIDGSMIKVDPAVSMEYFKQRPLDNQVSSWISPQSTVVESKSVLEKKYDSFKSKYEGKEIPYPEFWGGYLLKPTTYEFWQGQTGRLHDRVLYEYEQENNSWKTVRLAP